jgi:threonine dehydratase
MTPSLAEVYAARRVVARYLPPTPLIHSPGLSRRFGCDVHLKCENLAPIRSFKARGALYCLSRLDAAFGGSARSSTDLGATTQRAVPPRSVEDARSGVALKGVASRSEPEAPVAAAGVVCASTGNHGQGVALAARLFGRRAVVVVPRSATEQKMAAIRYFGAELRVAGDDLDAANEEARRIAQDAGLHYVEDGEDPDVLVGCATVALEIVEGLPELDCLIVPVGGGNLIAACALVVKGLGLGTRLVGVQSAAAPAVYESWRSGRPMHLEQCATFAGGLATRYPGPLTFPLVRDGVDEMQLVDEEALLAAARLTLAETGLLPEGAGAAPLAALMAEPARYAGQTVVLLLSGGNFEPAVWHAVQSGGQAG